MSRDPRPLPPGHGFRGPLLGCVAFWSFIAAVIFGVRYL